MSEHPPSSAPSGPHPLTVLLVDDDPVVRSLMAIVLGNSGHEVIQTNNGEEALELVESNPHRPIHLLITDMVMPRIGGNELASRLQSTHPRVRVLFCSGHPMEHVLQKHSGTERVHFISKPFSNSALLQSVQAALEQP